MLLGSSIALTLALAALPPGVTPEQEKRCAEDLTGAGKAFGARDYAAGEASMQRALKSCAAVDPSPEEVASRLETLADFQLRQSKWAVGLSTIARCLKTDRANPSCHFYKWFALRRQGQEVAAAVQRPVAQRALQDFLKRRPAPDAADFVRKRLETRQAGARGLLDILNAAPK